MSVEYNDPAGWGFCKWCAFEVAVDPDTGKMLSHERRASDWDVARCYGSLKKPGKMPVPPVAEPISREVKKNEDKDAVVKGSD